MCALASRVLGCAFFLLYRSGFGYRVVVRVNFKTGRHRTAALKRARPRWGAPT